MKHPKQTNQNHPEQIALTSPTQSLATKLFTKKIFTQAVAQKKWQASSVTRLMTLVFLPITLPLSFAAQAEIREGSFEFSPFIGHNIFENRQNLEDGFVYGGRFGYNLTQNFALEGAVSVIDSAVDNMSLTGAREGRYRSPMNDVEVTFYNLDALYHLRPQQRFSPYIVGGIGGGHYSPEIADKDMTVFNFGVGAKYWLNDAVALRFDVRDYIVGEVFQESFHNVQATFGLVFSFGGNASTTSAPVAQYAAPAPAPEAAEEVVLEFEDIHFDFDQSALTPDARAKLKASVDTLKANPKAKVRIAGYTSAAGTAEYNQELSERRAQAIKNFLVSEGIKPNRLTTVGYGDKRPASHEPTPGKLNSTPAKENMRALFEIVVQ